MKKEINRKVVFDNLDCGNKTIGSIKIPANAEVWNNEATVIAAKKSKYFFSLTK